MENDIVTSLRPGWDFRYKTAQVLEAAKERAVHHKTRHDWWENEMKDAEKRLKEKGFEYRQEQYSRGADTVIIGDPQLVNRVAECKRKMDWHWKNHTTYEAWVRALDGKAENEPNSELVLKIDDVVFFNL
jgi:hypothetical protein